MVKSRSEQAKRALETWFRKLQYKMAVLTIEIRSTYAQIEAKLTLSSPSSAGDSYAAQSHMERDPRTSRFFRSDFDYSKS